MNVDLSAPGTWCLAHLLLQEGDRERALYATALNFLVNGEGNLHPNWRTEFPDVVRALRDGPASNVAQFKPKAIDDNTG